MGRAGRGGSGFFRRCPAGTDPLSLKSLHHLFHRPSQRHLSRSHQDRRPPSSLRSSGELGESYAGGRLSLALRFASHEAVVIRGKAERPVYISINDDDVKIKDASSIWGIDAPTTGVILRDKEPGDGPAEASFASAAENLVRYACVVVDTYRHFGRLGLGAVFKLKNLKALVVSGTERLGCPIQEYREVYNRLYATTVKTDVMEKYHDIETSVNISVLNWLKGLPTKNQLSAFAEAEDQRRDVAEYLSAASPAPDAPSAARAYRRSQVRLLPITSSRCEGLRDHEPIYSLGSNLGIESAEEF